jgi:hypothetical protein
MAPNTHTCLTQRPRCSACGQPIEVGGERDLLYHLPCAPGDLLDDAVTEGNAVLTRGITYYVNKYLPDELRADTWPRRAKQLPSDEELITYAELFAKMLRSYRNEKARRQR